MPVSLKKVNELSKASFITMFADIAEHSPWVATAAARLRPFKSVDDMALAFKQSVSDAPYEAQLTLICAHPDLAGKAQLTSDSQSEQSNAGLDSLTQNELKLFTELNGAYKSKFDFPFIFAVKGADKHQILDGFKQRINNDKQQEFSTALDNIFRIFMFRIEDQVHDV